MNKSWPTKKEDMQIATVIMEEYARKKETATISLFELVVDEQEKRMDFRLADWVVVLALQFKEMYGVNQGDDVTRLVISQCLIQGETMH